MRNRKLHFLTGMLVLFFSIARGQENSKTITVEEAVSYAMEANATVKKARLSQEIAKENFKQTNAIYLPQVDLKYTAFATNNPLNAFGFKMQQQSITASDFNPSVLNHPDNTSNFLTSLDVQQPLLNLDKMMQRKGASLQVVSNEYASRRTEEQVAFETKRTFYQLQLSYKTENVLKEAIISAKTHYSLISDRFLQGLIQKSDLLNSEIQVKSLENQLSESQGAIKTVTDQLCLLMGLPLGTVLILKEAQQLAAPVASVSSQVPTTRSDFGAMETAIASSNIMAKGYRYGNLPKINAFGSYYLNDKTMLGFGSGSYLVGIQASWTLLSGTRTQHQAKAQDLMTSQLTVQMEEQKNQSQQLLNKSFRDMEDVASKIDNQDKTIEQAKEVYDLVSDRHSEGLATTSDLLMAQTQVWQQKLILEQLQTSLQILRAYQEFLTHSYSN